MGEPAFDYNIIGKTPNKIVAFPHKLELKSGRRSRNEKTTPFLAILPPLTAAVSNI